MTAGAFRFYASEVSYFSGKVRPALRYKRIPHEAIGRDAVPLILDTVTACEAWRDGSGTETGELPRAVGMHRTALRGVSFERLTAPYTLWTLWTLWMLQRCRDAHAALAPPGRKAAEVALAGTGCEAVFARVPRHRVVRRPFKLFLDSR